MNREEEAISEAIEYFNDHCTDDIPLADGSKTLFVGAIELGVPGVAEKTTPIMRSLPKGNIMTAKKPNLASVDAPAAEEENVEAQETIEQANRIIKILTKAKKNTRTRKFIIAGVGVAIAVGVTVKLLACSSDSDSDESTDSSEAASED